MEQGCVRPWSRAVWSRAVEGCGAGLCGAGLWKAVDQGREQDCGRLWSRHPLHSFSKLSQTLDMLHAS